MDPVLLDIADQPENQIFQVVFFPDRVYHERYLNATRSTRYRYDVTEVRSYLDIVLIKGSVYMDGQRLTNFLRIEYRASRLYEQARGQERFLGTTVLAWLRCSDTSGTPAEATVTLHFDKWIGAYQTEVWGTLEAPGQRGHEFSVLDMMGDSGSITRVRALVPLLEDIKSLWTVEIAFREARTEPYSHKAITAPAWDNNFGRTHQEPISQTPSDPQNTVVANNYLLTFQRGWFKNSAEVVPVRYRNAMMLGDANGNYTNPDARPDNIVEMRWLFQRELGGSMIFFHEVTVPSGKVEGNHQHVGSEELYYIIQGEGIAYLREGDDPAVDANPTYRTVPRETFGLGNQNFKELPVKPGSMILTKSGGMHGIRNPSTDPNAPPLKFVAFLYHTS